jgi:SAM-dependent methyltransferase
MKYLETKRGNRLYPKRGSRIYWHLTSLRKILEKILKDDIIGFNELLDYGCGNKPYMELFKKVIDNYVGADLPGNDLADIIINPDGTLPLLAESFSCVLSSQVLEHVEDPNLYLKESYRILKQDGKLILSTHGFWVYHPDPNDYWRWTSAGLKKIIEEAGFSIEKMYSVQSLPSISIQLWQDATLSKIPRIFKEIYVLINQLMMEFIDRRLGDKFNDNAGVFIVVAKKCNDKS